MQCPSNAIGKSNVKGYNFQELEISDFLLMIFFSSPLPLSKEWTKNYNNLDTSQNWERKAIVWSPEHECYMLYIFL